MKCGSGCPLLERIRIGRVIGQTSSLFIVSERDGERSRLPFASHLPCAQLKIRKDLFTFSYRFTTMPMSILVVWDNGKSVGVWGVCVGSGRESISIYFSKDTEHLTVDVRVWYVSPSVNTRLPNSPTWNVWTKGDNESNETFEWRDKWRIFFWNKKRNGQLFVEDQFDDEEKWLYFAFFCSIRTAKKKWREGKKTTTPSIYARPRAELTKKEREKSTTAVLFLFLFLSLAPFCPLPISDRRQ